MNIFQKKWIDLQLEKLQTIEQGLTKEHRIINNQFASDLAYYPAEVLNKEFVERCVTIPKMDGQISNGQANKLLKSVDIKLLTQLWQQHQKLVNKTLPQRIEFYKQSIKEGKSWEDIPQALLVDTDTFNFVIKGKAGYLCFDNYQDRLAEIERIKGEVQNISASPSDQDLSAIERDINLLQDFIKAKAWLFETASDITTDMGTVFIYEKFLVEIISGKSIDDLHKLKYYGDKKTEDIISPF